MRVGGLSIQKKAQFINVFYFGYLLQLAHPLSHISISLSFWVHHHSEKLNSAYSVAMGQPKIQVPHTQKI